jgi:hypothetical protein
MFDGLMKKTARTALRSALRAEAKSVAVCEAERLLLGRKAPPVLQRVLEEQRHQRAELGEWADTGVGSAVVDRAAGWAMGAVFACLPAGVRNRLHVWAKNESARNYERVEAAIAGLEGLDRIERAKIVNALRKARLQEEDHSRQFKELLEKRR